MSSWQRIIELSGQLLHLRGITRLGHRWGSANSSHGSQECFALVRLFQTSLASAQRKWEACPTWYSTATFEKESHIVSCVKFSRLRRGISGSERK